VLKLSHTNYYLPIVQPLEPLRVLESGTTTPQLILGVCQQTGVKGDYVIKYRAASRMSAEASVRELVAAWIARELGLKVPEPVIISVSPEFVELLQGNEMYQIASNSLGYNFGNEYQRGYLAPLKGQTFSEDFKRKLIDLFAFDMFISNADRRIDKPNFLYNGDDLLVFDHEIAFGFVMELPFLRNQIPWTFRDSDLEWISQNFCYQYLKGNTYDFLPFIDKLTVLNDLFWTKVETIIPPDWLNDQCSTIKNYLNSILENSHLFAGELTQLLL
jgi:hypothetical protein